MVAHQLARIVAYGDHGLKGLWLTGQDILTCGVTGAMMAGLMTTTAMVGVRRMGPLMKKIFN